MSGRRQPMVIYDGDCGICLAAAGWLRPRAPQLGMAPFQRLDEAELAALGLTIDECRRAVQVVTADGRVLAAHHAINYLLSRWWPGRVLVTILRLFPPLLLLESAVYRQVAANRHRLSRWLGLQVCSLPPPLPKASAQGDEAD